MKKITIKSKLKTFLPEQDIHISFSVLFKHINKSTCEKKVGNKKHVNCMFPYCELKHV